MDENFIDIDNITYRSIISVTVSATDIDTIHINIKYNLYLYSWFHHYKL